MQDPADFTTRVSALSPTEQDALEQAVHDVAAEQAANAINSSEEVEYLLAAGWTENDIRKLLDDRVESTNAAGRRAVAQYQAIADTSVDLSEEEDPAVARDRLKRIRKQRRAEHRRHAGDS